jgi:4-amino-4-deoxychorismate lyase
LWERHLRRLASGCRRLGIEGVDPGVLEDEARRVCAGIERGVLKIIVTRGEGGRGYRPAQTGKATRIVAVYPWPDYPESHWQQGVTLRICSTRLGRNAVLAGMKHLNRLEQIMARREWDDPRVVEGLMLDEDGHVIAGTMTNLFTVNAGRLVTPALSACGVEGVMRNMILDIATEAVITYQQAPLTQQDLQNADEVFITNALIGIWPVRRIEQQDYAPGPLTKLLSERLSAVLQP